MRVVVVLGLVVGAGAVLLLARDDAQQAALEDANSAVAPAPGLAATGRSPESKLHADVRALLEELSKADTDQARIQVLSRHRGKRFPHHPALVAQLVELLQSQDDGVRWYAVYTLQGFGPEAGPAVTALLASDLPEVRRVALHVLHGWLGRKQAIPEVDWLTLLDDDNAPVSNMALNCLMQGVAYDEAIAGRLAAMVEGPHRKVQKPDLAPGEGYSSSGSVGPPWMAAWALARMGPEGLEALRPHLRAEDPKRLVMALNGIANSRSGNLRALIPDLVRLLGDSDEQVRGSALSVVVLMDGDCVECLPRLLEMLDDDVGDLAHGSVDVVTQMGPAAEAAVPALLEHLKGKDEVLVDKAATALGAIGAQPDLVLPALAALIEEEASDAAAIAMAAYGRAGYDQALELLRGNDPDAAHAALLTFAKQGLAAASVVPDLIEILEGEDVQLIERAVWVVKEIGPGAAKAAAAVAGTLRSDPRGFNGQAAGLALKALGEPGRAALRRALRAEEPTHRLQALRALQTFQGDMMFAAEELDACVGHETLRIRQAARAALTSGLTYADGFGVTPRGVEDGKLRALLRGDLQRLLDGKYEDERPHPNSVRWYRQRIEALAK